MSAAAGRPSLLLGPEIAVFLTSTGSIEATSRIGGVKMRISIALALFVVSTVHAETSSVSRTGPLDTVVIQKRQFDVVTDGERVCMIPWGNAGHDPLRGMCQYAESADVPCTISGSYVRRGKNYVLGDDWTATPGRKETK